MGNAKDYFVDVAAGQTVFKTGQAAECLYVVESGQIDILHDEPAEVANFSVGPGEFLGEEAALGHQSYGVTALAKSNCRLLRIDHAALADTVRHTPDIGLSLIRALVTRQWHRQHALVQALQIQASAGLVSPAPAPAAARPAPSSSPSPSAAPVSPPPAPASSPSPSAAPVSPPPVPASSPSPSAAPVSPPLAPEAVALRVVSVDQVLALDPARDQFQVGRPDPSTGRVPEIDLGPFDNLRTLSRRHAKILRDGGVYFICEDTPTTNGTFLNGNRLQSGTRAELKPGDKVCFGSIEVEIVAA